jgi:hypothetical protein
MPGSGDAFLGGLLSATPDDDGDPWDQGLAGALGAACANAEMEGTAVFDPARPRYPRRSRAGGWVMRPLNRAERLRGDPAGAL